MVTIEERSRATGKVKLKMRWATNQTYAQMKNWAAGVNRQHLKRTVHIIRYVAKAKPKKHTVVIDSRKVRFSKKEWSQVKRPQPSYGGYW